MNIKHREILLEQIGQLLNKSVFNCLEITSKGNKLYLLKDRNYKIYAFLLPQRPLGDFTIKALSDLGFKEIWPKINFSKFVDYSDIHNLKGFAAEIELIFINILNVEPDRKWRFNIHSGMAVLKDNRTPLLTAKQRQEKNKKKHEIKRVLLNDFTYALALSLIFIVFKLINGLDVFPSVTSILILYAVSLAIVRVLRFILRYDFLTIQKKMFLQRKNEDYFSAKGFIKKGDRYIGQIKGYRTELLFSSYRKNVIVVYHKPISWERVLKLSNGNAFDKVTYNWNGMFYSQKSIGSKASKDKILTEAEKFVDLIINHNIEKSTTTANI